MELIYITKEECESIVDLIECNLFDIIRDDPTIDGMTWLSNIMRVYDRAVGLLNNETDTNVGGKDNNVPAKQENNT